MQKVKLLLDLLKGFDSKVRDHKKIIILFTATKFILDNLDKYKVNNIHWYDITATKETFERACYELYSKTSLDIYKSHLVSEFFSEVTKQDFQAFVSKVNEYVYNSNPIELSKVYRELSLSYRDYRENTTEDSVLKLAVKLLEVKENATVIDSFNGESGVMLSLYDTFTEIGKDSESIRYHGQELDTDAFEYGQVISFLLSGNCENIKKGDSLKNPAFTDWNQLKKFDYAISSTPFTVSNVRERFEDRYERFILSDYKTIQVSTWSYAEHVIATIRDQGKGAVLMPLSALFSSIPSMVMIRKTLVNSDIIDGIIKLPAGVLGYTNAPSNWIIINKNKDKNRQGKIQFIDLTEKGTEKYRGQKIIEDKVIDEVVKLYKYGKENDISVFVSRDKIEEYNYNLDIFEKLKEKKVLATVKSENMIPLKEIATIRRGIQLTKSKLDVLNKEENKSHYIINLKNVENGLVRLTESEMIAPECRWIDLYEVQEGDILITSKGSLFKIAIIDESIKRAILTANLFFIRVNKNKYRPEVLKHYLESEVGQKLIESISKGAVIKSISNKDLEELLVPKVRMEIQGEIVENIKKNKDEYEKAISEAKEKYDKNLENINLMMDIF